eukprot:CAMPEP_0177598376 /NCGR_PEP_ID=MMETSP0419_2-20121207/12308_1 /TAXON_ID=582737 /ORGANISM="Tetraselmis sp., Strain GSL018" /LENGTH=705 /DNA_ID=CAMNT_0019090801 /DNA_START=187 /DNA_END=2305 /DNA_ORIENTATION=+
MPGVQPKEGDEYWCLNVELPSEPLNLVAIEPHADQKVVHHMLLFGCRSPAQKETVYTCGMQSQGSCQEGAAAPLYGWGRDAPGLRFPPGMAVQVGAGTGFRMFILEVHYLRPLGEPDTASGLTLHLSRLGKPHAAGLMSFAADFTIPPRSPSFPVSIDCCVDSMLPVHAFAMRVHTHSLGRAVTLQRGAGEGRQTLAERDPREPQAFYNLPHGSVQLPRGTWLRGTCLFNSSEKAEGTRAGSTSDDEMCNVYLMVYGELPYQSLCGPPVDRAPGHLPPAERPIRRDSRWSLSRADVGQVAAVEAAEGGRLWVLHRGSRVWDEHSFDERTNRINHRDPIEEECVLEVDSATGSVVRSWGAGQFFMPHGLTADHMGTLWIADAGLHQVLHFSAEGTLLLQLGERLTPGDSDGRFCKPTQVAVATDGSVYVADGYCNARVLHFSRKGHLLGKLEPSDSDGSMGPLSVPHSLALDECAGLLLVADRQRSLVRAFRVGSDGGDAEALELALDTSEFGHPYGLAPGPYGSSVALLWEAPGRTYAMELKTGRDPGGKATLDAVSTWELTSKQPEADAPHDVALIPAPLDEERVAERGIDLFVAETAADGKGALVRHEWELPAATEVGRGPTDEDGDPDIIIQDSVDLGKAIGELYLYGLPFALLFAGVALFLWRRLGSMEHVPLGEDGTETELVDAGDVPGLMIWLPESAAA